MKKILFVAILSLVTSIIGGMVFIPLLKKIKASQTVLKYVEAHKGKNGTPTMGGLFFIIPSAIIYLFFCSGSNKLASVSLVIGLAYLTVGFIDDFIKIKTRKNEGLKPYQKIIFQTAIAIFAGIFCYRNGLTIFYTPFYKGSVDLGHFTVIFAALIFIAITNSVNLTDGLDGLSSGVSFSYLLSIILLISVEMKAFDYMYLKVDEYENLILLSASLTGGILGFLVFNVNKASVFMGDTGSLSLGGFLGAISIFSANSLFIPVIGICFVLSALSVIAQVVHYKRTKRRIFLMAPLHHHFQMKGYSEVQISYAYSLFTIIMGAISIIFYL